MSYTHYSLFENGKVLKDFARIPEGGLSVLLSKLHRKFGQDECCVGIINGELHPLGNQLNLRLGVSGDARFWLILMTPAAVYSHWQSNRAEGNREVAAKASRALKKFRKARTT